MAARVVWRVKSRAAFRSSSLYRVGERLLALQTHDGTNVLAAWSTAGKTAWRREFGPGEIVTGALFGDAIYLDGAAAVRIRAYDGETIARREFEEELLAGATSDHGPTYYVGGLAAQRPTLIGVDPESLEPLWRFPEAGRYICHGNYLCAYHPEQQILHRVEVPNLVDTRVPVPFSESQGVSWHRHAGSVWCQFFDHDRYGIDVVSGATLWHQREPAEGYHGYMSATTGTTIYCGKQGVSAYSASTGELIWRRLAAERLACVFEVSADILWVATEAGGVYLLDQVTGDVLDMYRCEERPMALTSLDRRIAAIATDQRLMVLDFS